MANGTMYRLDHAEVGEEDDILDAYEHRRVGYFSTQEASDAAIHLLRTKPGFRNWPGGFRSYEGRVNRVYWWGGGYGRLIGTFDGMPKADPVPFLRAGQVVYHVTSFRVAEKEVGDVHRDVDGPRNIGLFTSHDLAEAAIAIVKDNEEFLDRPDGFRITERVIDEPAYPDGY